MEFIEPFNLAPNVVTKYAEKFKNSSAYTEDLYSKEALDWFRKRITKDTKHQQKQILNSDYKKKKKITPAGLNGRMYFYAYKAESAGHAETQAYDAFPMVFFFNAKKGPDGHIIMYGLNVHYLKPIEKQRLLKELINIRAATKIDMNTRIRATWQLIKAVASKQIYEKAVHAYRMDRVKSQFVEIPCTDWPVVAHLNLQKWVHIGGENIVHSDTQKRIRR
jgi:hypothetical protein